MSPISLPTTPAQLLTWTWAEFEPLYADLNTRRLTPDNIDPWLADWSRLNECALELHNRLYYAVGANTADKEAEARYNDFIDTFYTRWLEAENRLKQQLLASGLEPAGFELQVRNMRAEAGLYREENLPLLAEEHKLSTEYDRIVGAQTVTWDGEEITVTQLRPRLENPDRALRERAWRVIAERELADRGAINALWQKFLPLRRQIAANAGKPDYRAYKWQALLRFDYTPADTSRFHLAIETAVVPVASRIYQRRREKLRVDVLRPWDLDVDPLDRPALQPFQTIAELNDKAHAVFSRVHPDLGDFYARMVTEKLLDLDNRKNKAPGGYCTEFPMSKRPFIFANAVGIHEDVLTILHEGGHAFHLFESNHLPLNQQRFVGAEFAEVASMGMELLSSPYLDAQPDGFYSQADANRARIQHLESIILFWPYMAVVDAFQDWVYTHPDAAQEPANCDAAWADLWQRFMPGVDYSGLEDVMVTGWQRKLHIHLDPFYFVEYGLAELGAVQVWRNSLKDPAGAVAAYRRALSLGGTAPLPDLFAAAGARLSFDADTLGEAVGAMEMMIRNLSE